MKHIQQLHVLLTTLLADRFSNRSLEDNKKTMTDLINLQSIVFDQKQRYGNPSYEPVPLERELRKADNSLAQVIYDQLSKVNLETLDITQLMEMHKNYETFCWHRDVNNDGKVWKAQSKVRCQIVTICEDLEDLEQATNFLNFVIGNSNGGHEEHKKAKNLLLLKEINSVPVLK